MKDIALEIVKAILGIWEVGEFIPYDGFSYASEEEIAEVVREVLSKEVQSGKGEKFMNQLRMVTYATKLQQALETINVLQEKIESLELDIQGLMANEQSA